MRRLSQRDVEAIMATNDIDIVFSGLVVDISKRTRHTIPKCFLENGKFKWHGKGPSKIYYTECQMQLISQPDYIRSTKSELKTIPCRVEGDPHFYLGFAVNSNWRYRPPDVAHLNFGLIKHATTLSVWQWNFLKQCIRTGDEISIELSKTCIQHNKPYFYVTMKLYSFGRLRTSIPIRVPMHFQITDYENVNVKLPDGTIQSSNATPKHYSEVVHYELALKSKNIGMPPRKCIKEEPSQAPLA